MSFRAGRLPPLIFALSCLPFLGAISNSFVWDDLALIVRTIGYRGFDARHLTWMFTTFHMANYSPLMWLSFSCDYFVWGLNPAGFHLTNILLHGINSVLFYFAARELLRRALPNSATNSSVAVGAAFAAVAFAVHPMRVESVAWASERRDVLAGLFFLCSLLAYLRAARRPPLRGALSYAVGFFALAALSKPTVVPYPLALLALDAYPLRRLPRSLDLRRLNDSVLIEKIPFFIISAVAAGLAVLAQVHSRNFVGLVRHGAAQRLIQAVYGLGFYVGRTAFPVGLSALYPLPTASGILLPFAAAQAVVAFIAETAMRRFGVPAPARRSLWLYYFFMILPVLGLLQNGAQLVALRYSYLSCLGWFLLFGAAAATCFNSPRGRGALAVLCVWLVANAVATSAQVRLWRDDRTLWTDVLKSAPDSCEAHMNLAFGLVDDPAGASWHDQRALELCPDNPVALLRVGATSVRERRWAQGVELLQRAVDADPDSWEAHELLAEAYLGLGRRDDGVAQLRRAVALNPRSPRAGARLEELESNSLRRGLSASDDGDEQRKSTAASRGAVDFDGSAVLGGDAQRRRQP